MPTPMPPVSYPSPNQIPQPATQTTTAQLPPMPGAPAPYDASSYPVDYLNTIAPPQRTNTLNKFAVFGMIFAVIAIAIFAIVMMTAGSGAPNFTTQAKTAQGRLLTLQKVVDTQQKHLTDNNLRATNTTLSASLTSMNSDLKEIMKKNAIKSSETTLGAEKKYGEALTAKLDEAYLTGTLDRSYASEMTYQLALLKTQLKRLKIQSDSKSVTEFYDKNVASIDFVSKQLSEFSGAK